MVTILLVLVPLLVLTWFSLRYAWWRPAIDYRLPRILMYHMVCEPRPGAKFNKLRVSPKRFASQLEWLSANGWQFRFVSDLADPDSLPRKCVILTFDDGYQDNLLNADPVLQRHGACATIYPVVERFDRDWSTSKKAHHDSGELMREPKLSNDQLKQMVSSNRWEVGGHTITHANLARLDTAEAWQEIAGCQHQLGELVNAPVRSFAYPFGIFTARDVKLVKCAGFTPAVTTEQGISVDLRAEVLRLKRIKVSGKDGILSFSIRMRSGSRGWRQ